MIGHSTILMVGWVPCKKEIRLATEWLQQPLRMLPTVRSVPSLSFTNGFVTFPSIFDQQLMQFWWPVSGSKPSRVVGVVSNAPDFISVPAGFGRGMMCGVGLDPLLLRQATASTTAPNGFQTREDRQGRLWPSCEIDGKNQETIRQEETAARM